MLIFWPQRLVLLATPKTGTTSLEAALEALADVALLRPRAMKHLPARVWRETLAPYVEASAGGPFRTVALVREPQDWLGSWYRARLREAEDGGDGSAAALREDADSRCLRSFADFVEAHLSDDPPPVAAVGSQSGFLSDGAGGVAVDLLFRYDRFQDFTDFLEGEFDCEIILPRLNASPARDLDLPDPMLRRLRSERAADFALYDSLS